MAVRDRLRAVEAERVVHRSLESQQPHPATPPPARQGARTMLVEIAGDIMNFQTLSRTGRLIDSGTVARQTTGGTS